MLIHRRNSVDVSPLTVTGSTFVTYALDLVGAGSFRCGSVLCVIFQDFRRVIVSANKFRIPTRWCIGILSALPVV